MSKVTGLVLIAIGIGVAAYAMPGGEEAANEQAAETTLVIKTVPPPAVVSTAVAPAGVIVPPVPKPAVRPAKAEGKTVTPAAAPVPTIVTVTQRADEPKLPSTQKPPQRSAAAVLPGDRAGLTRELQRELKRVGCYDSEISGVWSPASRRAMKAFTDRVNATLPIDEPDYILLTLVQGRSEQVCGAPCPAGQGMAADGRCLPTAVMAQAGKKTSPTPTHTTQTSGWSTTLTAVAPKQPLVPEGRMALAGPTKEPVDATKQGTWTAKVEREVPVATGSERPVKRRVVEKPARREVAAPRRKFGPWFFRQQYSWNY